MYRVTTAPTGEAVDLAIVKQYLVIEPTDTSHDDLIKLLMASATEYLERHLGMAFLDQSITERVKLAPGGGNVAVPLSISPMKTITAVNIRESGAAAFNAHTDFDPYPYADPPGVVLRDLPSNVEEIEIVYAAGFGAATDIPASLRGMVLLRTASLHTNRTEEGARMSDLLKDVIRGYQSYE